MIVWRGYKVSWWLYRIELHGLDLNHLAQPQVNHHLNLCDIGNSVLNIAAHIVTPSNNVFSREVYLRPRSLVERLWLI